MPRKLDIELTSRRDDGSWTWRAPGARQPRGVVDAGLVPDSAAVGDVLRADAEFEMEGIVVVAVAAPRPGPAKAAAPDRIEILGSGNPTAGVSVMLAPGGRRRRDDDGDRRPRGPSRGAGTGRTTGTGRGTTAARSPGRDRDGDDAKPRRERPPRRPGAETASPTDSGPERRSRPGRDAGSRPPRARGLQPAATHRNAALAALLPEQIPVAEQLLRGGIPAVRQAIDEQNSRARSEGRAEVSPEPLLAMAEELLPVMNLASWKDRAVAARDAGKDAPLRDIRSIVAGASTVVLDDEGRELAAALRTSLTARVTALRDAWIARITSNLDSGQIAEALRQAAKPPEPSGRVPADLAVRLAESASAAMGADLSDEAWLALLDAVVASPVRRTVKPAALPTAAGEELRGQARRAAGQVPELARLLGLPIPPPPGPRRPATARRG